MRRTLRAHRGEQAAGLPQRLADRVVAPGPVPARPRLDVLRAGPHAARRAVALRAELGAARGVGEAPDRAVLYQVALAPLHEAVEHRPQLAAALGQHDLLAAGAVGAALDDAAL